MLLRCAATAHRVRLPACRAQYDTPQPAYPTRTPFQTRTPPPPAPGEQLREPRLGLRLLLEPRPPAPPPLVEQLCCASQTGALHGTAAATHRLPDALRRAVRGSCTRAQKHSVPSAAAGGSRRALLLVSHCSAPTAAPAVAHCPTPRFEAPRPPMAHGRGGGGGSPTEALRRRLLRRRLLRRALTKTSTCSGPRPRLGPRDERTRLATTPSCWFFFPQEARRPLAWAGCSLRAVSQWTQ